MAASQAVTKHLIDLGHRRIAYFTGQPVSPSAQERYEGYRRALREANIVVDDRLIFNAGSTIEEGEKAALQMLNEQPKATAVQAANDLVAIGAAAFAERAHRELLATGETSRRRVVETAAGGKAAPDEEHGAEERDGRRLAP